VFSVELASPVYQNRNIRSVPNFSASTENAFRSNHSSGARKTR